MSLWVAHDPKRNVLLLGACIVSLTPFHVSSAAALDRARVLDEAVAGRIIEYDLEWPEWLRIFGGGCGYVCLVRCALAQHLTQPSTEILNFLVHIRLHVLPYGLIHPKITQCILQNALNRCDLPTPCWDLQLQLGDAQRTKLRLDNLPIHVFFVRDVDRVRASFRLDLSSTLDFAVTISTMGA